MSSSSFRRVAIGTAALVTLVFVAWNSVRAEELVAEPPAKQLHNLPLLFSEDFQSGNASRWEMNDPKAWKVLQHRNNHVLSLTKQSMVKTPVRSPYNRALIKDLYLSDCVIDVRLQSTVKDYNHRDLCIFLGYQDPKHFYYVHLAKKADKHANQIFIVDNTDRELIDGSESTAGTNWDDHWHHVRVVRKVQEGLILVYFDDMEKPVMRGVNKEFKWGQVGVGSFDDLGDFDNVHIYGVKELPPLDKRVIP